MSTIRIEPVRFLSASAVVALISMTVLNSVAHAQVAERSPSDKLGRVEFDFDDAPPATVEVDLKEGMLSAVTGIGKAAVEGVVQALAESDQGGSDAVKQSAEHLQTVNDILGDVSRVIREVRVRVYEGASEQSGSRSTAMLEHYQDKLAGTEWENVVRVRDDRESVVICILQHETAIRGVFVMVSDANDLILANVVCQLTPESVKELTHRATKLGMRVGLGDIIEEAMQKIPTRR